MDNSLNTDITPTEKKRLFLKPWRAIGWGRRVFRLVWMVVVGLWIFSLLQVFLGIVFNPPLTPLMVQRFGQQLFSSERHVRFQRDYVSIDDISPHLVTAVVYAEDGLFMYHHGFDVKQMKQAYREIHSGRRFRGGSTISQQTAKNAFLPHSRSMFRKGIEAYYTLLIERFWGKKRIMEVYLNVIEFGDGIYGAEAAAQHYFGHSAKDLTRDEAVKLAVTLPAPLKRNPAHQSPFYRRQVQAVKGRMGWGRVNLDMPLEKRQKRFKNQETIWDFFKWYREQQKKDKGKKKK